MDNFGCFHILAIANNAVIKIGVHVSSWWECKPQYGGFSKN